MAWIMEGYRAQLGDLCNELEVLIKSLFSKSCKIVKTIIFLCLSHFYMGHLLHYFSSPINRQCNLLMAHLQVSCGDFTSTPTKDRE